MSPRIFAFGACLVLFVATLLGCVRPAEEAATPEAPPATIAASSWRPAANAVASYRIDAEYDPATFRIAARQSVFWTNPTAQPTDELYFHLYLNAFSSETSTWMREYAQKASRQRVKPEDAGESSIDSMTMVFGDLAEAVDLLPNASYVQPADGNADDKTLMRVPLPISVQPGQRIEIALTFSAKLSKPYARTGRAGDYAAGTQWFPKLGVFMHPRGDRSQPAEWIAPQFHGLTEFFADYGSYRVSLTMPERYRGKIASTGVLLEERDAAKDGWFTSVFEAQNVHDFAWFADPDFVVVSRDFVGAEERDLEDEQRWLDILGREAHEDDLILSDVRLTVFLQPEHGDLADRHLDATEAALRWFGRAFKPYPYSELEIVDPQFDARGTGGMEYPGVFTSGTRRGTPEGRWSPEGVTVHEAGHQWFYGIIGTNEFDEAFLDEGFNTYAESTALTWAYETDRAVSSFGPYQYAKKPLFDPSGGGSSPLSVAGWLGVGSPFGIGGSKMGRFLVDTPTLTYHDAQWAFPWAERARWLGTAGRDRVRRTSHTYADRSVYGSMAYRTTSLTLDAFRRAVGDKLFYQSMRRYVTEYSYGHPTADDYIDIVKAVQQELYPNWTAAVSTTLDPELGDNRASLEESESSEPTAPPIFGIPIELSEPRDLKDWIAAPSEASERRRRVESSLIPPGMPEQIGYDTWSAENLLPLDPEAYFDLVWSSAGYVDFNVRDVKCLNEPKNPGEEHDDDDATKNCRVLVENLGPWKLPVDIEITYDDDSREYVIWNGQDSWVDIKRAGRGKVKSVRVDPFDRWVFDKNLANNQWSKEKQRHDVWRVTVALFHELSQKLLSSGWAG